MFSRISCIFFILFFIPLINAKKFENFNHEFSANVAKELKDYNIPGGAYAIIKGKDIVALETFGHTDKSQRHKVDSTTIFRLASVSKTFASTITTMLAQEKKLDLSDSVTKYVPQFSLAKPGAAEKIQLKHLLSHSSGLTPNAYDNLLHENWSMNKVISHFERLQPICEPARCYGYQNIAYGFLQPAIESSQSKSYANILEERIFSPLNMQNASVGLAAFQQQKNTAKPHVLSKRIKTGKQNQRGEPTNQYIWRTMKVEPDFYKVAPAAGINASITDLAKWLVANLGYQPEVLPPSLLNELTTPRIKTRKDLRRQFWREHLTDAHYGYGWRIYQFKHYPIIYHSGWVSGFRADIGYSPELDVGFAVLINAESNVINKISSQFWAQAGSL